MKWILTVFVIAVALIGAGVVLTDGDGGGEAVSASPEAHLLCEEGVEALHGFRWQVAVDKLGRALELDPSLAEASVARVRAFANLAMPEEMKKEVARADSLTAAIEDFDRRLVAAFRLAHVGQSRFAAHEDSLTKAMEDKFPRNLYLMVYKARAAYAKGDQDQAKSLWEEVIELDPNYTDSYNMLGYGELNRGNYDEAIDYMQKYAFLAPELANPHDSLGEVYMTIGRYEEAEAQFLKAVSKQPDFYYSLINLGKIHLLRGQIAKGTKILQGVREKLEGSDLAMKVDGDIINFYYFVGLEDEIEPLTAEFVSRYPDKDATCVIRAMRLADRGEFREGQALMDSCLSVWRSSEFYARYPSVRFEIDRAARTYDAVVAGISGETQTAVRMWQHVVDMIADNREPRKQVGEKVALAEAFHDNGQPEEALAVLEPLMEVNARFFKVLDLAVESYVATDRPVLARKALEQYKWCADRSDPDFRARDRAVELETLVLEKERAGSS